MNGGGPPGRPPGGVGGLGLLPGSPCAHATHRLITTATPTTQVTRTTGACRLEGFVFSSYSLLFGLRLTSSAVVHCALLAPGTNMRSGRIVTAWWQGSSGVTRNGGRDRPFRWSRFPVFGPLVCRWRIGLPIVGPLFDWGARQTLPIEKSVDLFPRNHAVAVGVHLPEQGVNIRGLRSAGPSLRHGTRTIAFALWAVPSVERPGLLGARSIKPAMRPGALSARLLEPSWRAKAACVFLTGKIAAAPLRTGPVEPSVVATGRPGRTVLPAESFGRRRRTVLSTESVGRLRRTVLSTETFGWRRRTGLPAESFGRPRRAVLPTESFGRRGRPIEPTNGVRRRGRFRRRGGYWRYGRPIVAADSVGRLGRVVLGVGALMGPFVCHQTERYAHCQDRQRSSIPSVLVHDRAPFSFA